MKYKLINTKTKEETICDKVTTDGFDYYVSDAYGKPAIATNNPKINIPKVVDEVEKLAMQYEKDNYNGDLELHPIHIYKEGYNKSQETHPFSEEDMIEFAEWLVYNTEACFSKPKKELLQIWKEQQLKTVYYE